MHSVGLGSQSKMSMIFSALSEMEDGLFRGQHIPLDLDIPCSFRVQTIIDFNFCLQATAGEESGVNLTSSGGFAVIATLWMGMADIDVTKIATPIPGILS